MVMEVGQVHRIEWVSSEWQFQSTTCYYCKQRGRVKAECPALAKKSSTTRQNPFVAPQK